MRTCTKCKIEKVETEYFKATKRKDGQQPACKACMNISYKNSRSKKLDHYNKVRRSKRQEYRNLADAWKSKYGCAICKEDDASCLDLHHINPEEKEDDPSNFRYRSFKKFLEEAKKCIVLCSNCHRKLHANKLSLFPSPSQVWHLIWDEE